MKIYYPILLLLLFLVSCEKSEFISNVFVEEIETEFTNDFFSVEFPTSKIGYIGGSNGVLLKSIDAGETWDVIRKADTLSEFNVYDMYFQTSEIGIIIENKTRTCRDTTVRYSKTEDGGLTWEMYNSEVSEALIENYKEVKPFFGSYKLNSSNKFQVNDTLGVNYNGKILNVVNQDTSVYDIGLSFPLNDIDFSQDRIGFIVGEKSVVISTDEGRTWEWLRDQNGASINHTLYGVSSLSTTISIAVGELGAIVKIKR